MVVGYIVLHYTYRPAVWVDRWLLINFVLSTAPATSCFCFQYGWLAVCRALAGNQTKSTKSTTAKRAKRPSEAWGRETHKGIRNRFIALVQGRSAGHHFMTNLCSKRNTKYLKLFLRLCINRVFRNESFSSASWHLFCQSEAKCCMSTQRRYYCINQFGLLLVELSVEKSQK